MLLSFLRLAFRNAHRNFQVTLINILGLTLGLSVFIITVQFISHEFSYDRFHTHEESLYRLIQEEGDERNAFVAPGMLPLYEERVKGVAEYCRVAESKNVGAAVVQVGDQRTAFRENNFAYADGNYFSFFSFPVIQGNAKDLIKPYSVALSTSTAKKYFNTSNPIGKNIVLNNQFGQTEYTVTSVFENDRFQSDLIYDMVFSLETLKNPANLNGNGGWASMDGVQSQWMNGFLKLDPNSNIDGLNEQLTSVLKTASGNPSAMALLQPLSEMHLGKTINDPNPKYSSLTLVYILIGISFVILSIALFNYINLTTANSLKRAKEVGLRKITGASRLSLIFQFAVESAVYTIIALMLALAVVNLIQEPVNVIVGKPLRLADFWSSDFGRIAIGAFIGMCLLAGLYVGVSLSSFKPMATLRGAFVRSDQGTSLRKGLIIFQFAISVTLITVTIALSQQFKFLMTKSLGMETDQMVILRGPEIGEDLPDQLKQFENEIANYPFVQKISRSGNVPFEGFNFSGNGIKQRTASEEAGKTNFGILTIDNRFFETYNIPVLAGREFTTVECLPTWNEKRVIALNERAVEVLGFTSASDAIGQKITWGERELEIVAVIADYHHLPLRELMAPIVFIPSLNGNYFSFKLNDESLAASIETIRASYQKSFPGNPFEYQFLEESKKKAYQEDSNYTILFTTVSLIAILIALLGILGLMTFMLEQRIKEVGIRRVLGGTIRQIMILFGKDFILLTVIAAIIASPVSVLLITRWLEGFPYRIDLSWSLFLIAPFIAIALSMIIVFVKVYRSTAVNPSELLRVE